VHFCTDGFDRACYRRRVIAPTRPPPKVLLIDDGASDAGHFNHLTAAGLEVSHAHGGVAVDAAIRFQPDIIILDFRCDGEIMAKLKGDPTTRLIPVIALAALGGGDARLTSPIDGE
jgi:CheY-like chemotaxis protein